MKTFIVTGVSRGLGQAFYRLLLPLPVRLILIGKVLPADPPELTQAEVIFVKKDLADLSQPIDVASWIHKDAREIVFINNAGTIDPLVAIGSIADAEIIEATAVNFVSPAMISNQLAHLCKHNGIKLRILNISSGAAARAIAGWGMYCSTKAAMKMFYECLASENDKVTVRHIDPGVMDTAMQEKIRDCKEDVFAFGEQFMRFKRENLLRSPDAVAKDILIGEDLL